MGYRKYAKDYEVEEQVREGKRRKKYVRIYVGTYYRFVAPPERVAWLKRFYAVLLLAMAVLLLIPMLIDCNFTRSWFVAVPSTLCWLPWIFAAGAAWRLWTAGEKVVREHRDLLHDRMSGASLFLMGFACISVLGCVFTLFQQEASAWDYVVCADLLAAAVCSVPLFSHRKELEMEPVPDSKR